MPKHAMDVVVLDFETTGLSPASHRVIEVGAVEVSKGRIQRRYQQLIHPGGRIPDFITSFTGITNEMVAESPRGEEVMPELMEFIGHRPIVCHNAGFDAGFLRAELARAGYPELENPFLCTMRLARRLFPDSYNHKLGTLKDYLNIDSSKRAHRALADAEVTGHVWLHLNRHLGELADVNRLETTHYEKIMKWPVRTWKQSLLRCHVPQRS